MTGTLLAMILRMDGLKGKSKELETMSEDLHEDGWTLFDVREIEVSNHINGEYVREIVKHERYVKEINGEWFYKDIEKVTPLKLREYIDIDGNMGPFYEWVKDE